MRDSEDYRTTEERVDDLELIVEKLENRIEQLERDRGN